VRTLRTNWRRPNFWSISCVRQRTMPTSSIQWGAV